MFGILVREVETWSSRFYLTWMHRITNTFVKVADFILPWVISSLCVWCVLKLPKEDGGDRLNAGTEYIFILVNQIGLFVYNWKEFYPKYCEFHEY